MSKTNALSSAQFAQYYACAVMGVNGMWIFRVLLSWSAWDITHDASFVGIIAMLTLLPVAITGPVFGALIDRSSIKLAFAAVASAMALCAVGFLALSLMGAIAPVWLLLLAAMFGLTISAYHPVRQSMGPRLVSPEMIGSVVALSALNFNIGRMLSPAIAGILIDRYGLDAAAILSVAMFLPNLGVVFRLRPRALPQKAADTSLIKDLIEGARAVMNRWAALKAILIALLGLGPIRALTELMALLADGKFGLGAEGLGLLTSAAGGGALIAAMLQIVLGQRIGQKPSMIWGMFALGYLGTIFMVSVPSIALVALGTALNGFASAFLAVSLQTSMQSDLPDELRGRVMSFWMLSVTLSTSIYALIVSGITEWIGLTAAMLGLLACTATLSIMVALSRRSK